MKLIPILKRIKSRHFLPIFALSVTAVILLGLTRAGSNHVAVNASQFQPSGNVEICDDGSAVFGEHCDGHGGGGQSEIFRHTRSEFTRYENTPSGQLPFNDLTFFSGVAAYGPNGQGNFRTSCVTSHLAYDDPIVAPGQSGATHLHNFFGNTGLDANTTSDSLLNSGGSTCQGYELNRTGYWFPALIDDQGNARIPDEIVVYYKSGRPQDVVPTPTGLKMIGGSRDFNVPFDLNDPWLYGTKWACGTLDVSDNYNVGNTIPICNAGDDIRASITFPQCNDGRLDSSNHRDHMFSADTTLPCPASHPIRFSQVSVHIFWNNTTASNGWYISSDRHGGLNAPAGSTLHADWYGGWHEGTMNDWTEFCINAVQNCAGGQLGTRRDLLPLPYRDSSGTELYTGDRIVPIP